MSSSGRLAPIPPPKPRTYGRNAYVQKQVEGLLTPQDSDTDSGISADCDQNSPRLLPSGVSSGLRSVQSSATSNQRRPLLGGLSGHSQYLAYRNVTADYLTPDSARKIAALSTTPRRLPVQPQSTPALAKSKPFRVRFADEVDSGASTSSETPSANHSPRNDCQDIPMNSGAIQQSYELVNNNELRLTTAEMQPTRMNRIQQPVQRRQPLIPQMADPNEPGGQFKSIPEPPSYSFALQRLRKLDQPTESLRDAVIRRNVNDTLQRRFRQRSSSLPRGTKSYFEGVNMAAVDYQPYIPQQTSLLNQLPGSLDNLHITVVIKKGTGRRQDTLQTNSMRRRKLPTAPLMGSSCMLHMHENDEVSTFRAMQHQALLEYNRQIEKQPTLFRQIHSPRYLASVDCSYESNDVGVRAQLVALDQRGFRRVLVEKLAPGPFGFYIATGLVANQRGIFITRLSLPSLSPMLSIGDEIIYVDEEFVKGHTLEYVQSLIAGKTSVTLILLPAVGQPAMC